MKEETREQKLESLRDHVRLVVAGGFESYDHILELAGESALEDFATEPIEQLARQIVGEEFEKHFREQATWPPTTDCDKLDAAFAELNRAGVVARQNFSCCGTCAARDILDVMSDLIDEGKVVRGYTSYDIQSTESAVDGYGIALNYGSIDDCEAAALRIGHEVVDALARHGLRADWDGTWKHRIMVR